jgi:hypothetical protein
VDETTVQSPSAGREKLDPTLVEPPARKRRFGRWRKSEPPTPPPATPAEPPAAAEEPPAPAMAPPGFHIYRPSKAPGDGGNDE